MISISHRDNPSRRTPNREYSQGAHKASIRLYTIFFGFSCIHGMTQKQLDIICSMITKKNCGNFQTYIGYKYKIDVDYLEDKCIIITIGIIGKWSRNVERKEQIITWAERYRVNSISQE